MPLHPESQQLLDAIAANERPGWDEMPVEKSREVYCGLTDWYEIGPTVDRVEDVCTSGPFATDGSTDAGVPLRIYQSDRAQTCPVVLYFHGGGFVLGDLESHETLCRRLAVQSGLPVVAVDYRRAPEHRYPAALDDGIEALKFLNEHGRQLGFEGTRVIVAGDSAGGNLAAAVAMRMQDHSLAPNASRIIGQLLIYPVLNTDFQTESYRSFADGFGLTRFTMKWFWEQYLGTREPDAEAAPLLANSLKGLPQCHIITAEYDILRDEGEAFAAKLQDAGVTTSHRRYDGMLHAFMHFTGAIPTGMEAIADAAEVLRRFAAKAE